MKGLSRRTLLAVSAAAMMAVGAAAAHAEDTIKVGLLATLEGAFTVLGEDSVRGAELAFQEHNYMAGGKKLVIVKGSSDASPDSAVARRASSSSRTACRSRSARLGRRGHRGQELRQDPAAGDLINGPRRRRTRPCAIRRRTSTASRPTVPNGRRVSANMPMTRAIRRSSSSPRTIPSLYPGLRLHARLLQGRRPCRRQILGPIGNKDFSSIVASIPDDIDAVYVALGGPMR
jgi:branched-chain amino acid transport system substrate-binding protein